ncbi:MAG TPA: type II toxin-antitoxin system antitoxin SocA domain-containing protein [Candidatus Paceibacterota bacterium]|nr:type II toxin-antitoxin system antitoxin SocA domain-containing protein [Candidatus Paceibacterota bacterium]
MDIQKLRKEHGMTQADLANRLGMSRPTLIRIEKGERPLTAREGHELRMLFGMLDSDAAEREQFDDVRISIPQKNLEKFKQVLLYVLKQAGAKPNIGMTALYKLLYFIDFDYYEKYGTQLMGLTYFKNTHGPAPREFIKVVNEMKEKKEVDEVKSKYFTYEQRKFLPLIEPDLAILSAREKEMIDNVLLRYSDKSASELSRLSHIDTPWDVAKDGEDLDYEHVFYRPAELSVREYDEL